MAIRFKPCAVPGCNGNANSYAKGARGYCGAHYQRLVKHGSPTAGFTGKGEPRRWLDDHSAHDGAECLIWPFTRNTDGYPMIGLGRGLGSTGAHRLMCCIAHGEPPTPAHQAAHSCGNGHLGCVHPGHVRWDTCSGNQADKIAHGRTNRGTRNPKHRLTEDQVRAVRAAEGRESIRSLARRYGVSRPAIKAIFTGRNWGWLS